MATRSRIRGLMCSTSKGIRFYDRDVSAALNIRRIAAGPGRPRELSSWLGRPAMPHPGGVGQEWALELRKGKFNRLISSARDVLHTIAELQLPVESSASMTGVTLLPSATVEGLLVEKRKLELVQPFKLALLKLASQEAARLMAAGEYELALPVALDAVQQGQLLFKPAPALQLFPLYLLAAQANLGLRRAKQCEDFLALASWLAMKEPGLTTNIMKSQLSRLYGQLYAFQVRLHTTAQHSSLHDAQVLPGLPGPVTAHVTLILKLTWGRPTLILIFKYYVPSTLMADGSSGGRQDEAVAAFAEDVYYCAVEYGPEDPRTTLGFYNMGKVHQNRGDTTKSLACTNMVVKTQDGLVAEQSAPAELPVGRLQLMEVVDMLLDIGRVRLSLHGSGHSSVADAHFVTALALVQLEERERASEQLEAAAAIYAQAPSPQQTRLVEMARIMLNVI
ncbi:hypothetical protein QJQ45_011401 [Haematococcus lacustris]|nr:hypothetical protein QJQ45_011401 [Haematococcus lacustris]